RLCSERSGLWYGPRAGAKSCRQLECAVRDFEALERIVEQPIELSELAGIGDARQRTGEMQRLCGEKPAADCSAEPVLDMGRLAQACGRQRIAQPAELRDLETHGIDGALRHELEDLAQGARALVGLDGYGYAPCDQRQALEVVGIDRLLAEIDAMLSHPVESGDRVLRRVGLVGVDG